MVIFSNVFEFFEKATALEPLDGWLVLVHEVFVYLGAEVLVDAVGLDLVRQLPKGVVVAHSEATFDHVFLLVREVVQQVGQVWQLIVIDRLVNRNSVPRSCRLLAQIVLVVRRIHFFLWLV